MAITNASEYRATRKNSFELTLPSGAVFLARPFGVIDSLEMAKDDKNKESWAKYLLLNCILSPKIIDVSIDKVKENELALQEITEEDKSFIIRELSERSKKLGESFFTQPQSQGS
jgi:hypothetical protein